MKNVLILHGCCSKEEFFDETVPSSSNSHWLPWIQKKLITIGIPAQTPEMPQAYEPEYENWKRVFNRFAVDDQTLLVGHSCGAGFLLRWLGETKKQLTKLILVAPWLDLTGKRGGFLDFEIDRSIQARVNEVHVLFSSNDKVDGVKESVEILRGAFAKAKLHDLRDKGHFTSQEMKTAAFPELLNLIAE
jgi:predicted alpha/beta hydrolase family esterase